MQTSLSHFGSNVKFGTVKSVTKEGFLNVLTLTDGSKYSTSSGMDGRHKHSPTPHTTITTLNQGDQIVLLFGNRNGFKYETYINHMMLY